MGLWDPYVESVAILLGINSLMALSMFLPYSVGQLSVGQGGFMAIGAYAAALLTTEARWPFAAAMLAGGVIAGAVGVVVGFPALRVRGMYLAMLTLGFGEVVRVFFLNVSFSGGPQGLGGLPPVTNLAWVYGILASAVAVLQLTARSSIGLTIEAIRSDEIAAEAIGINLTLAKLTAFGAGGLLGGIAGALFAHYTLFIDPAMFGFQRSVEAFLFVTLGGVGTFWGGIAGAVVLTALPEILQFLREWRMVLYGSLILVVLYVRPQGLVGRRLVIRRSISTVKHSAIGVPTS